MRVIIIKDADDDVLEVVECPSIDVDGQMTFDRVMKREEEDDPMVTFDLHEVTSAKGLFNGV